MWFPLSVLICNTYSSISKMYLSILKCSYMNIFLNRQSLVVPSNKILAVIQPYLYQWDPCKLNCVMVKSNDIKFCLSDFKYPVRILSAGTVVFVALIVVLHLLPYTILNYLLLVYFIQLTFQQINLLVILAKIVESLSLFESDNKDLANAIVGLFCKLCN